MENERSKVEVAVVGAGIIGLAIAWRLAAEGREVLLIDAETCPLPASAGNAGTIAAYNNAPVGSPGVLRSLPHLLTHADSPFTMRWAGLPALTPWLLRFLRECLPARARANAAALASLLHDSLEAWHELADATGTADLLRRNGALYVFPSEAAFAGAAWPREQRAAAGIRQQIVGPREITALEPALQAPTGPGIFFPEATHIVEPAELLRRLRLAVTSAGVRLVTGRVDRLERGAPSILLAGPGLAVEADRVVIAAGAWSRTLARQAGDAVPLDTERGYHVEYALATPPFSRPVCPIQFGVYVTPMAGRLRAAGTVELGGLARPPDPRRPALLDRAARSLLPDLPPPTSHWMGFRPSLPDSLPVIGRARGEPRVVHAFGHGHLGLTLAAVTARHVADLLSDREPAAVLRAFSPQRF
ncbi:cytochrome c4 [Aliidongia dinghuensis]|uniref:Cytochrome c4 n=1 Tax=Aliidongia dinghuensis TaxID=1867774 RepID=A0A8J2YUD9_9PROT|nr:FAD-dependent oxidoreductase [Aliidongia dinghuensis]GGF20988.1 cytochrome c4 [Aliidongia dinghuensis]